MKSTEVYREARQVLGPWCKANGFGRTSGGLLGWHKALGDKHLVFWLQCDRYGWDPYAGSSFVVEFQLSPSPQIGAGGRQDVHHRLPYFLTGDELRLVQATQNKIIHSLTKPPTSHFVFQTDQRTIDWYLTQFKEIPTAYTACDDIWLRYATLDDVKGWSEFLLSVLPRIHDRLTGLA